MTYACKSCGATMSGDGFRTVLHCKNAIGQKHSEIDLAEPDSNPIYCTVVMDRTTPKKNKQGSSAEQTQETRELPVASHNGDIHPTLKTHQQVIDEFHARGISIVEWAESKGVSPSLTYQVLHSNKIPLRGESHKIAVKLGIKHGVIVEPGDWSFLSK